MRSSLQDCTLDGDCAALFTVLFPKLHTLGNPTFRLVLDRCKVTPEFYDGLASARLHKLTIHSWDSLPSSYMVERTLNALQQHSIVQLSLAFPYLYRYTPIPVSALGHIPDLQSLSIKGGGEIQGLHEVLSESVSLRSLMLINTAIQQDRSLASASPHLRHLRVSSTDASRPIPTFFSADFPSLQTFGVGAAVI